MENGREKLHRIAAPHHLDQNAGQQTKIIVKTAMATAGITSALLLKIVMKRQEQQGDPEQSLLSWKLAIYKALTDQWQLTSTILDLLPEELRNGSNALQQCQRNLRLLEQEGLIEQHRQAKGEGQWRRPHMK